MNALLKSLPLLLATSTALAAPHQHGQAYLDMVLEPPTLLISISSPLANLTGFEYQPATKEEQSRWEQVKQDMQTPDLLIRLPEAADCSLSRVLLQSPFATAEAHDHDHGDHGDHGDHQHADLMAEYQYVCARAEALRQLELPIMQKYPDIERLRLQFIAPDRLHRIDINAGQDHVELP